MKQKDFLKIIPGQYTGSIIEAGASVELEDSNAAMHFFEKAKKRLLCVNNWHDLAGLISAKFQVVDKDGYEVDRAVQKGDYLRINIPGPGSKAGDGYDWVMVEELKELNEGDLQCVGFRVRPASNPSGDQQSIAHFYNDTSTSNFIITRDANKVTTDIIDRNIKPNDDNASLVDKIRDTAVGMSAIASFSKLQWQGLADGLVDLKK